MKIFITTILLIGYVFCFGQIDSTAVPFVSYWALGDSYDFKVTKIIQQWKGDKAIKNDSTSYNANFEVVDSTGTSYKIRWSYKTNLSKFNIPTELNEIFLKYKITEVIYHTNEVGEFIGIENWQEIATMMNGLFTDLIDMISENQNTPKEDLLRTIQPLLGVYNSKEGIEQLAFKELQYFHFPFGVKYSTKEPIKYEDKIPNMFGEKPIRGNAKIYFEEVNFEDSYCVMVQEMTLNPDDSKDMILTLLRRMGVEGKDMKKAMKNTKFNITDFNRYEYYFYPGVPVKIEASRESIIDIDEEKGMWVERTTIELLE